MNEFIYLPRFKKNYKKLSSQCKERVNQALIQMENNLNHPSLVVKKVKGTKNIWEARVSLSMRITFNMEGNTIILRTVGEHDVLKHP
jgi:mRNA interferase RelE/StbE